MEKEKIGKMIKKQVVRASLLQSQSVDNGVFIDLDSMPVYDDVIEQLNIAYINRDEVPLAMDVFKPDVEEGTELPVVVTIHGGGFTMGDRRLSRPFGRLLAHRGYLTFSLEYRLAPKANICQALDDVCAGLDLVGRMLVDYDVDFTRVFIAAESAGAYLATYVTAMRYSEKLQEAIGYKPGRPVFKAIGLMSGMLYTNRKDPCGWILKEQFYGEKVADENFLQYMNPEHPEILNNLPPTFLITSRGDFVNHYSIMMNEALKKAGKPCHLLYYGDINLQHAFTTLQLNDPRSIEAVDKMLAYFEEHAAANLERKNTITKAKRQKTNQLKKMNSGKMDDQPVWKYNKERALADPERLSSPAVIDCTRTYTYAQMYDKWDEYARVFSGLGITGANNSRVGLAGAITAEPFFAFYGLNMVGAEVSMLSYPDFIPGGRWKDMVRVEKITDLIITDIMVTPQLWGDLQKAKKEFGLRNIILVHSLMGGPCVGPAELAFNEFNYHALQRIPGTVFLNDLLVKYKNHPIEYGKYDSEKIAVITHTSGSTKGTRKPLPYTNRSVNAVVSNSPDGWKTMYKERMPENLRFRTAPSFDLSSFFSFGGVCNTIISAGDTLVFTFFGFMHPKFARAVAYYKLNGITTSSFMLDSWMNSSFSDELDFSSLYTFGIGGSYVTREKFKAFKDFATEHGYRFDISKGYGMSETGSAQLIVPENCDDDILGYPMPPQNYYILDETDNSFHCVTEGVREGVLYVTSHSMAENMLDGQELFKIEEIEGRKFVCTNDCVRVNEDISLSYVGRMDKFFVNNEGIRFESGIVETAIGKDPCVGHCAIAPVLEKRIHDTVPVLYIVPEDKNDKKVPEKIAGRLYEIYTTDKQLIGTALPSQLVIIDSIPCTATGKIDIYQISRTRTAGSTYNIVPSYDANDNITDIRIELTEDISTIKAGTLPKGLEGASSMGLFEVFNAKNSNRLKVKDVKKMADTAKEHRNTMRQLFKARRPKMKLEMPNMEDLGIDKKDMLIKWMDLTAILYNHDTINHDFED